MQNRLADAIGLPLDAPIELATRHMRESMGLEGFGAAKYTARGGWGKALLARIVEPLMPLILRNIGRITQRRRRT